MNYSISYNKVELLPIICNHIGIDKLIFDVPHSEEIVSVLTLNNESAWVSKETGEVQFSKGNLRKGIEVKVFNEYIRFSLNPSIILFQSNFFTTKLSHLRCIIDDLELKLGINLKDSTVRRIDLQSTISVDHSPISYFNLLGSLKNYIRQQVGTSLYYSSKGQKKYKTTLLYDKKKKEKINGIPIEYQKGDYLRIEGQYYNEYLKKVVKKLNLKHLTLESLLNDKIYSHFLKIWYDDYANIYKETQKVLDMNLINKPSDVDNILINQGIEHFGGMLEVEKTINASKPFSSKGSDFFSKTIRRIKDKSKIPSCIVLSPLLTELNSKVKASHEASTNYRT